MALSCRDAQQESVADALNLKAYQHHYINLDSVSRYASLAYESSADNSAGRAAALNNMAFVSIMKMQYDKAAEQLKEAMAATDNQFELLVANVQMMRVCQRKSENKEFYVYQNRAARCIERIKTEPALQDAERRRFVYGETEYSIVLAAYLYYIGQTAASVEALVQIDEGGEILRDTAQLLNYYYNVGDGNFLHAPTPLATAKQEMEYLQRCYVLAEKADLNYWTAKALQAMCAHLLNEGLRDGLIEELRPLLVHLDILETDGIRIATTFASLAAERFAAFGDVYQTAASLRTLAQCYFEQGMHEEALATLDEAISDSAVASAASLIASINEQYTLNYAAADNPFLFSLKHTDYIEQIRNTTADRTPEAIMSQLQEASRQQNLYLSVIIIAIGAVLVLLILLTRRGNRSDSESSTESLLLPLSRWQSDMEERMEMEEEAFEELLERQQMAAMQAERGLQQNLEQRAKMALISSITPFIDRLLAEVHCLTTRKEKESVRAERYAYIAELTEQIDLYNQVLTAWIQLRKGELNLKIESFPLQKLFDILKKGQKSFRLKGVDLQVGDTPLWVKADRTLTLFMINTLADNARKFTPEGGRVSVKAEEMADCVEISVADTGCGMDEEALANVFSHQPSKKTQHGFGLMNCKGIIEKYRKTSNVFSVCQITAESTKGIGSTFRFRLPKGVVRKALSLLIFFASAVGSMAQPTLRDVPPSIYTLPNRATDSFRLDIPSEMQKRRAIQFADSVSAYCLHRYADAIAYADSVEMIVDAYKLRPFMRSVLLSTHYNAAMAALGLHDWPLYRRHNAAYFQLYREASADPDFGSKIARMQKSTQTKNITIMVLVILLLCSFPAYYGLYYRHRVHYHGMVDCVNGVNEILFSKISDEEKLERIKQLWNRHRRYAEMDEQARELDAVVRQVCDALESDIERRAERATEYELANDELRRLNLETERLHINNNVLDNCFSTLKHETMYYPAHIKHLVESRDENIDTLAATAEYYKDLYTILSAQAQSQIRYLIHIDKRVGTYIRQLLTKLNGGETPEIRMAELDATYLKLSVPMPRLKISEEQACQLFTPSTVQPASLVVRQIVREIGETTNLRRSGTQACIADGTTMIEIIIPKKIWKNLRLS